jgi:hypothetical protein
MFFVVELIINPVCCSLGLLTWRIFWFSECLVLPFFAISQIVCLVFFGMSFPHIQLTLLDLNVSNEIAHTTHIASSKCEYLKLHTQLALSHPNVSIEGSVVGWSKCMVFWMQGNQGVLSNPKTWSLAFSMNFVVFWRAPLRLQSLKWYLLSAQTM